MPILHVFLARLLGEKTHDSMEKGRCPTSVPAKCGETERVSPHLAKSKGLLFLAKRSKPVGGAAPPASLPIRGAKPQWVAFFARRKQPSGHNLRRGTDPQQISQETLGEICCVSCTAPQVVLGGTGREPRQKT